LARLNEGAAMDLASGIFTAPVPGIYHFEFSALKDRTVINLDVDFQLNGVNVGRADTKPNVEGSEDRASLTASFRLKTGDRVNLFNTGAGVIIDNANHLNHFTGWLVEEDLI